MTAVIFVMSAIIFFLLGFILGGIMPIKRKPVKKSETKSVCEDISREYLNFLSYDGTEQI